MNSFDLVKFRNQLLTENTDRFYAPDYIAQKYGADKAKEIEANIEDEGANMWDLYKSLETSQEVDNFIGGFLSENSLVEAKDHSFTFNYNTDPDDVEYIQRVLDNAGVDAIAKAGTFDDEMIVRAFDTIGLRKARKAIEADGFEISEVKMTNADKVGSDGVATEDTMEEGQLGEALQNDDLIYDILTNMDLEQLVSDMLDAAENNPSLTLEDFLNRYSDDEDDEDELDEGTLEEMASFYKLTDNSPEALAAIAAEKEKYKKRPALYNTLDALEKTGEADYKEFQNATKSSENPKGKDMATWNNTLSRDVLEKDLAAFVQAGSSPSAKKTGRPADPNKAAALKDKSPKLKITNPKPKSNSTKLKDLAPADAFAGMDDEEIEMEKQALKAAKNADAELGDELGKVSGLQAAKDFLKRNADKTLNIVKKSNAGQELTSNEQKYLDKTRKLTSLIKKDKASFTASNISGQEEA